MRRKRVSSLTSAWATEAQSRLVKIVGHFRYCSLLHMVEILNTCTFSMFHSHICIHNTRHKTSLNAYRYIHTCIFIHRREHRHTKTEKHTLIHTNINGKPSFEHMHRALHTVIVCPFSSSSDEPTRALSVLSCTAKASDLEVENSPC